MNLDEAEIQASTKAEFKVKLKCVVNKYVFDKLKNSKKGTVRLVIFVTNT